MALEVPINQIDPTDDRITRIVCYGCLQRVYVEKGSDCDIYNRCSRCTNELDKRIQESRNDT